MLNWIEIAGCPPYGELPVRMGELRPINFIYGANGTGKTTLSRLLANADQFSKSTISWHNDHKLQCLVYNRDFVHDNFSENGTLKGIFTLGKHDIDIQNQILAAKAESATLLDQIGQLKSTLDLKEKELAEVEDHFRDECWKLKVKHNARLKDALRGFLNDKRAFKDRLAKECERVAQRQIVTLAELEQKAASLYGETPINEASLPTLQGAAFLKWESDSILARRIIGKSDVDIAAIIQKLGNSDWVKQGVPFLNSSDGICPFCQQQVPDRLAISMGEYFDETFLRETAALAAVESGYKLEGERLRALLQQVVESGTRFVDMNELKAQKEIFSARLMANLQRIAAKVKEPSQIVALESLTHVLEAVHAVINLANERVKAHNSMVANLASERNRFSEDVWAFLAHSEILDTYREYCDKRNGIEKAKASLLNRIKKAEEERTRCERAIRQLEKNVTSIQPTVNEINRLLSAFGFRSFHLEAMKGNLYRLCRPDGSDAQHTLSEGERSFITFLYFFHLLKGSTSEAGLNTDRIVVFDDPVSSLDSDVLFIVSALIKQTIEEARSQVGNIRQVFILTHNVYFFREVIFDAVRSGDAAMKDESFWTVHKINDVSSLRRHTSNPIKSSYDLMWAPLREPNFADQSLQNNMRRILEHYFRMLGGFSFEAIVNRFDGEEKLICRSLLSWVNEGSHSVPDDIFHTLDESAMRRYIAVFREIFLKMGHLNHYNMMIGPPFVMAAEA